MNEMSTHILTKMRWDTSFDWKEKSIELQERLSSWSKNRMPINLNEIFNKFCPPSHTLKIETLEIDLGRIDFNNLEAELSKQLNVQLYQKLIDLIINENSTDLKINLEENIISQLKALRYFLINGLMPWNYQQSSGSINELFVMQIQHNLNEFAVMLREIGSTSYEARKRLAWQTHDTNIHGMIRGLEPTHHETIIGFSRELIKVKTNEDKIKGDNRDFKKNLWLWIFNYLLAERGTTFNKIAFMKSNINQMANHYSISYNELLMLLNEAIHRVSIKKAVKQEFAIIINTLVEEEKNTKAIKLKKTKPADYWVILKHYFLNHHILQTNRVKREEFNELVISLSRENQSKFSALIILVAKQNNFTTNISAVLSDFALESIVLTLNVQKAEHLIETIFFLDQLNSKAKLNVKKKLIWEFVLDYLLVNRKSEFNQSIFLSYYISRITTQSGLTQHKIAEKLLNVHVSSLVKTVSNLTTFTKLTKTLETVSHVKNPTIKIKRLLEQLTILIHTSPTDREKIARIGSELLKNTRQNPKLMLSVLMNYVKKEELISALPYFIDSSQTISLVVNSDLEYSLIFNTFQKLIYQFKKVKITHNFAIWIELNLSKFGLETLILFPKLSTPKTAELILRKLYNSLPIIYYSQFEQFVDLLTRENVKLVNVRTLFIKNKKQIALKQVYFLIENKENKTALADVLSTGLKHKEFNLSDLQKHPKKGELLNYMLKDGEQLLLLLQKEYHELLTKNGIDYKIPDLNNYIEIFFLQCLISYPHHGNKKTIEQQLKQAIIYRFNMGKYETRLDPLTKIIQTQLVSVSEDVQLTLTEVFALLEEFLKNGLTSKVKEGKVLKLSDLLNTALREDASRIKEIAERVNLSKNKIETLSKAIPYNQFNIWLSSIEQKNTNEAFKSLSVLFSLSEYLLHDKITTVLLYSFWDLSWNVLRTGRLNATALKNLVHDILFEVAKVRSLTTGSIILEIQDSKLEIPLLLTKALSKSLPNFTKFKPLEVYQPYTKKLIKSANNSLLYQLSKQLICAGQIPIWFGKLGTSEREELLNELINTYPFQFFEVLKRENISTDQLNWLNSTLNFKLLIKTIGNLNSAQRTNLQMLAEFYASLTNFLSQGISALEVRQILFKKIIGSWINGNWKILNADNIWKELIWEICIQKGIDQRKLVKDFVKLKFQFPATLQLTLSKLEEQQHQVINNPKKEMIKRKDPEFLLTDNTELLKDSIYIQNAGLVLINQYIPMLFERLGITNAEKKFIDGKQLDAVHYLQYVAAGISQTEEPHLALNKILCGIPLKQPIKDEILISNEHIELIEQLIDAVIGHWPEIGTSSIDGFRGNWIIRNGLLIEYDDKWELTIEKRSYDLLIHKSPFTFSIIKYPWMSKPLYVQWPY